MDASRSEQRALVRFLIAEWRQLISDLTRQCQANIVITNDSIAAVDEMIRVNQRVWTRDISDELNPSKATFHTIVHQHLQCSKVCAGWVPKRLTLDHQKQRMGISLQHLIRYEENPEFLARIIAGDESWCHQYTPESKKTRSTINSTQYCSTLTKLRKAIKSKRPGLLTQQAILLHDNARPYVSRETKKNKKNLQNFRWEVLEHPPYSKDFSPCDFHIFGLLKRALQGERFHSDDEVKEAVEDFLNNQPRSSYSNGIALLPKRWDLCYNAHTISFDYQ
ncbi:Histone-lysine N-methyltransferase SETMAR [Araneus ventricosus]|uniref:Histone-lysine N-methyltransferase SETMAR n=1 Tax=Araneus ventricosus TaxID=182803 RepID=A0A4Y2P3E3_ARAVE|nr:Histone-lysine N-methyltransferase SETMAR [Araneus ventricosus]